MFRFLPRWSLGAMFCHSGGTLRTRPRFGIHALISTLFNAETWKNKLSAFGGRQNLGGMPGVELNFSCIKIRRDTAEVLGCKLLGAGSSIQVFQVSRRLHAFCLIESSLPLLSTCWAKQPGAADPGQSSPHSLKRVEPTSENEGRNFFSMLFLPYLEARAARAFR